VSGLEAEPNRPSADAEANGRKVAGVERRYGFTRREKL
jgi:hypothetical protein